MESRASLSIEVMVPALVFAALAWCLRDTVGLNAGWAFGLGTVPTYILVLVRCRDRNAQGRSVIGYLLVHGLLSTGLAAAAALLPVT